MQKLRLLLGILCLLLLPLPSCSDEGSPREAAVGSSSQALSSTVHEVSFNVGKTIAVKAGDVIRLSGFPSGWTYTSVEVNFDGAPEQLDLTIAEQADSYAVTGWNDKIVVRYRGTGSQDLVVTRGAGNIRVHFWVSSNALTQPDGIVDGPAIRELAAANTPLALTAGSGVFRISTFPSTTYNVVELKLEARDGQPLEGQLSAGGMTLKLSGTTQKILFRERGRLPLYFDLSFPAPRSVAITWSVQNRVPETKLVQRATTVTGSTVKANYAFTQDHAVEADLSLTFNSTDFVDGVVPAITRLAHNPQNVRYPDRPDDLFGPTYDIHARPKAGKRVQVALPIPEIATLRGIEETDITILHHDVATNTWSEILPDRIQDGYVYFTTDTFSSFLSRMKRRLKKAATAVGDAVVDGVVATGKAIVVVADTAVTIVDGVKDGIKEMYGALVSGVCSLLEIRTYKNLFYGRPRYNAPPPELSHMTASLDFSATALAPLGAAALTPIAQTPDDPKLTRDVELWRASTQNAQILLADIFLAAKAGGKRRFKPVPVPAVAALAAPAGWSTAYVIRDVQAQVDYQPLELFRFTSPVLAAAPRVLQFIQECDGMLGLADEYTHTLGHVKDFIKQGTKGDLGGACREALMLPADIVDWMMPDAVSCGVEAASFTAYYLKYLKDFGSYDEHVLEASSFFNVASVMLWADPELRNVFELGATTLRNQMHSYVGLTHEAYANNNIVIKGMAGVALWDLVSQGEKQTYGTLKRWLEAKSGSSGGYAEGTGYLQYVNADVPYVLAAMTRLGSIDRSELPTNYLKTGEWLLNALPFDGGSPVEVDDGLTYAPDFFIYSYLNNDLRYQAFSKHKPATILETLRPLAFTDATEQAKMRQSVKPELPPVSFVDGIGVVRAKSGSDAIALSVVAESGDMRAQGAGHDQQDNGSVTLSHSRLQQVIVDPGYSGFGNRNADPCTGPVAADKACSFTRFRDHNVVMTETTNDFHGEKANGKFTYGDIASVLANQPNVHNLDFAKPDFSNAGLLAISYVSGMPLAQNLTWGGLMASWAVLENTPIGDPGTDFKAGGADAALAGVFNDTAGMPAHGLEVRHTSTAGVTNHRLLASHAQHMWIIDRPEAKQALWSRTNWSMSGPAAGAYANAFQSPKQPDAGNFRFSILQKDDTPPRDVQQRTHRAGSASEAPVFVTALPHDGTSSSFAEVACKGAVCARRTTSQGDDLIIVPHWGQAFDDCGSFFQGFVRTGQVVFAHKDAGSSSWLLRLVGEEAASVAAGSPGAQTGYAADAVYQVGPGTLFQARFPNGTIRTLTPATSSNRLDDFTQYTYSKQAGALGTFADFRVVRGFGRPIQSIKVTVVSGQADDVGYVGNMRVTSESPGTCGPIGVVSTPVDVTSQVTVNGDSATLLLRARENCGVATGWGSATQAGRADARLRWEVTFADGC